MKKIIFIISTIFLFSSGILAQSTKIFAGANASYLSPIGSFADRFQNTVGTSVYFGYKKSPTFSWIGKIEYFKFDKLNRDKLYKKVSVEYNGEELLFEIPLDKLEMEFEAIGLSAEAKLSIFKSDLIETSLGFGFGFYKWDSYRSEYADTVYAVPESSDSEIKIKEFDVPKNDLTEYSGTITAGIENDIKIVGPLRFNISGYYKVIIGELWPALALDIENVSGIQMIDIRAGFNYSF